ncbi:pentatricopeptide repeat-containing protein [Citrus sinensis]|nr:pentatricopeptide repeat-containing protein [Citrus sinensis]
MPDQFTFGSIIRSISGLCCVGLGRQLYAHVIKSEHRSHLISQNALIAMYTKFDRILDAWNVFSGIARKDITSWGSMIAAFSKLDSARIVFNEIESPDLASWNAIIARVARAGCMHEADDFINQMAFDADIVNILKIDPTNSAALVLLCNIYASSGKWEEVARLRGSMKERGVRKVPGQSWIEIQSKINVFFAEDVMHPERDKIYTILEELWLQMLDEGYVSIHMLASTEQLQWSNKLPPHYSTK